MTFNVKVIEEDDTTHLDDVILEVTVYSPLHFVLSPNMCVFIKEGLLGIFHCQVTESSTQLEHYTYNVYG